MGSAGKRGRDGTKGPMVSHIVGVMGLGRVERAMWNY